MLSGPDKHKIQRLLAIGKINQDSVQVKSFLEISNVYCVVHIQPHGRYLITFMILSLNFSFFHSTPDIYSPKRAKAFSHRSDMPPNTSKALKKLRLATFFLAATWFVVACLSSTVVHLASILLDHATHNLANGSGWILDIEFRHLMNWVFGGTLAVAIISSLLFVFGAAFLFKPSWLSKSNQAWAVYGCIQLLLSFPIICIEGYLASKIHGFRCSFEFFGTHDHNLYYEIMYYGATGKAIFCTLVLIFPLVWAFLCY